MGPYLELNYSFEEKLAEREVLCRKLIAASGLALPVHRVREVMDEVALLAARPTIVRKRSARRLFTHLEEMLTILEDARLGDTLLAHEVAAVVQTAHEGYEKQHPNFSRKSTLPDWVGRALPILHALWCQGSKHHGVHRRKDQVSPALQFMTDAINLFIPGTTVSSINYLWPKVKHGSPK